MYKLEMHTHSKGVSHCADITPAEEVAVLKAAGYHGMVSTNHINLWTFYQMEDATWEEKVHHFMSGYNALKEAAGDDFDVLLGCEINLSESREKYLSNDYLVYGVTEDWLLKTGEMLHFTLKQLSDAVREAGLLLVQAHPFRYQTLIMQNSLLDGVEAFNGNAGHDSHDYLAYIWAKKHGLLMTSGSDLHHADGNTNGGILTEERIRDNQKLLEILRSGRYELEHPEGVWNI